jgi:hypothetical protein
MIETLLKARPSLLAEGKEESTSLLDDKFDQKNSRVELHDDIESNVTRNFFAGTARTRPLGARWDGIPLLLS